VSGARRGTDRTQDVARAALACFRRGGYRLTQIAHVSESLGISVGTIYRYVESKEALLLLAVMEASGQLPRDLDLPLEVGGLDDVVALVRSEMLAHASWPILGRALETRRPKDVRREAEAIAGELYDSVFERAALVSLVDRCAHDIPELAELFDSKVRLPLLANLKAWALRRRLVAADHPSLAEGLTRGAMEAVVWLARNRREDRTATGIDDAAARAAAVAIFTNALVG